MSALVSPKAFLKNTGYVLIAQAIEKLRALIFLPLLTRYLGKANYGAWSQVGILTATFAPLIFLGTDAALIRYLSGENRQKQQRSFSAWCLFVFCGAGVVSFLLIVFRHSVASLFWGESKSWHAFLPLAAAMMTANAGKNVVIRRYKLCNDAKVIPIITLCQVSLNIVALSIALLRRVTLYRLVMYTVASDCAVAALGLLLITVEFGWEKPDLSILRKLLKYGIVIVPAGYAMWGLNAMDRIFLAKFADLSQIGIYATSYSIGYLVIPFMVRPFRVMFSPAATGYYNQGKLGALQAEFHRSAGIAFTLAIPASAGLYLLGDRILTLVAGPEFVAGSHLLPLISGAYIFSVFHSYFVVSLTLVHKHIFSTLSAIIACGTNFVLNWVLIPRYSIAGAAAATVLSFAIEFLFVFAAERKYAKILQVSFRFVLKVMLCTAVMIAVVVLGKSMLFRSLEGDIVYIAVLSGLGGVCYAGALFATGLLTREKVAAVLCGAKK